MTTKNPFSRLRAYSQYAILGLLWIGYIQIVDAQSVDCVPGHIPLGVERLANSTPIPSRLAVPLFSSSTELVPFGDTIYITAPIIPAGATLEYSTDNGNSWIAGNQLVINNKVTVLARVRSSQQISLSTQQRFTPYFQRMMVVGNSIMNHDPAPSLGWFNSNGMAASAPQNDFVHLLTARLQNLYPAMTVKLQLGVNFERQFGQPGYTIDEFNQPLQDFKPDLVVIRLGENVADDEVPNRQFETQFRQLVERLAGYGQPVRIVTTTSVWNRPQTDAVIRKVIAEKGYPLVDLRSMVGQGQYFASQYADPGVAIHPNDLGMARITELIWSKFQ